MTVSSVASFRRGRYARFSAVVRYELLWNLRKKKFLAMLLAALALSILILAITPLLSRYVGLTVSSNPDHVIQAANLSTFYFFFALVTAMNSISGEFESGSIVPLLTKPVSRTEVFAGKLSAAVITLIPVYSLLIFVDAVGGTIIYGPQHYLYLTPLLVLGAVFSTTVWVAIVLSIGSLTKSSLIALFGALVIYIAVLIVTPVVTQFMGQTWILTVLPGSGAAGYIPTGGGSNPLLSAITVSSGSDQVGNLLIQYILHPSASVTFYKLAGLAQGTIPNPVPLYTSSLSTVLLQAVAVAAVYIAVFGVIAWYGMKRAQISE